MCPARKLMWGSRRGGGDDGVVDGVAAGGVFIIMWLWGAMRRVRRPRGKGGTLTLCCAGEMVVGRDCWMVMWGYG